MDLFLLYVYYALASKLFGNKIFSHLLCWERLIQEFVLVVKELGMILEVIFFSSQEIVELF